MNWSAFPLILSGSMTILSIGVGATAYHLLEQEEDVRVVSLGLGSPPTRYNVVESKEPSRCVGTFTVSLASSSGQTHLTFDGWIRVGLDSHVAPVTLEATAIFNALGQLSVSLARARYNNESLRFGTTGVNPLSFQLYRGDGDDAPLFHHSVPGPIELALRNGVYELHAPLLSAFHGIHSNESSRSLSGLSVIPASTETSCDVETARHIDLAPLIQFATSFSPTVTRSVPGL